MARRHRKLRPHYFVNLGLSLLVLAAFGLVGAKVTGISSAATTNPYGYADYCLLESNTTVIYGWAADPNATSLAAPSVTINAGGRAVTVNTNVSGYRDAAINAWIDRNRPGDPKPGTYGFRAPISGLYKGNAYTITGTVLNEGPGSSVILTINNGGYTDGNTSHPYFANNQIPQACLATQTSPPPNPTPGPAPNPQPGPRPTPGPTPAPAPGGTIRTPTSAGTVSNAVDTTTTVGTLAASILVPADGASAIHLIYGTNPVTLDQSTPDQSVTGDSTTVLLTGLAAATIYYFQIVRSNNGQTATSVTTGFTTLGYTVAAHFVDNQGKGIEGISASLDKQKSTKKSNNDGNAFFNDVTSGDHTINYTYSNTTYHKSVSVTSDIVSPDDAAAAKVVTVNYTIDLQAVSAHQASPAKKDSSVWSIIVPAGLVVLAIILGIIGYTHRRRRNHYQDYYEDFPTMGLPEYEPSPAPHYEPLPPADTRPVPPPEYMPHTGESLKQMVLRSMAEEARRREAESRENEPHEPRGAKSKESDGKK